MHKNSLNLCEQEIRQLRCLHRQLGSQVYIHCVQVFEAKPFGASSILSELKSAEACNRKQKREKNNQIFLEGPSFVNEFSEILSKNV